MFNRLLFTISIFSAVIASASVRADFTGVIPCPAHIETSGVAPVFFIDIDTDLTTDDANKTNARLLTDYISNSTGIILKNGNLSSSSNHIILALNENIDNIEGYKITVSDKKCLVEGKTPAGVFYGIQTLRKSFIPVRGEAIGFLSTVVTDAPRFAYRGAMLDVSRHFFSTDEVRRFIDMLAIHNINRFHWHLSDDQGWRIEIKSRPELTAKASVRPETVIGHNTPFYDGKPHGGFYTQDEIRQIVSYAADRQIVIVPEIDLPGHAQASLTAYPDLGCTGGPYELWKIWGVSEDVLCAGNDSTYVFLKDVLGEVADLFPGDEFHIGGDECPKRRWHECPKCQAKIKELGLKDEESRTAEQRLQRYVMEFAQKFLASKGKRVVGWDEMLEGGIGGDAVIMSWRGEEGGINAARMGLDVIMTPKDYLYFDFYQTSRVEDEPDANGGYIPLERVYSYNPLPDSLTDTQKKHILGLQACLWTAYMPDFKTVEYMSLPRLAALGEVQWCDESNHDYSRFSAALPRLMRHYDNEGLHYSRRFFDVAAEFENVRDTRSTRVSLRAANNAEIRYTLDGSEPDSGSLRYVSPIELPESAVIKTVALHEDGNAGLVCTEKVNIHKGTFGDIILHTSPHSEWTAGGAKSLIDGLNGNANRESGRWMGFRDENLMATIDLGEVQDLSQVEIATCMIKNQWTFHARKVKVELSVDGTDFSCVTEQEYPHITWDQPDGVRNNTLKFTATKGRYVRVTVEPDREPEGYQINGGGYVFVDEIVLR